MLSINLLLIDARTMRRLNKEYRGIDKPTTVLSFNYLGKGRPDFAKATSGKQIIFPKIKGQTECLGEIFICLSQARKKNLSFNKLVIHGLKNLLSEIPSATDMRVRLN